MQIVIRAMFLAFAATAVQAASPPPTEAGQVIFEYVAHAFFRITSPAGHSVLIDPYQSRWWLGFDFPEGPVPVDAILTSHPHPDHDGGRAAGEELPWQPTTPVIEAPGFGLVFPQAFGGYRRPGDVPAQAFQLVPLISPDGDAGMERESCHLA